MGKNPTRQLSLMRAKFNVEINLDPVPGWGNNPEDFRLHLERYLNKAMKHYEPTVETVGLVEEPTTETNENL